MVQIYINDQPRTAQDGSMIIEATDQMGLYVPRFCYHSKLSVAANCRMCLVEVKNARKPAPACATPVSEGMEIYTHSQQAKEARRNVMEFLLINHPLDCPICDQGGECDLQDLAIAQGISHSRFTEGKRSVADEDLGPLIQTEMTRCIHCTRCVRFGEEIGGLMELGATHRSEHMEIGTYVGKGVKSELSGNMIDLCPVGAITSKPYRYRARVWEMWNRDGVCPHCSVGCNLRIQGIGNQRVPKQIKRILPRINESINEQWLCDKGRFSYEAIHHNRVTTPLVRWQGEWTEVSWEAAIQRTAAGLQRFAGDLAGLIDPTTTLEEMWLTQHLIRGLGGRDIDHRTHWADTDFDETFTQATPLLGSSLEALERLDTVLIVNGYPRKDQPLTNHRLKKAAEGGAAIAALNPIAFDHNFELAQELVYGPGQDTAAVAAVAASVARDRVNPLPKNLSTMSAQAASLPPEEVERLAQRLVQAKNALILVGTWAQEHPQAAEILALVHQLGELAGCRIGYLAPYANSVGAWAMGCVPRCGPGGKLVASDGIAAPAFLGAEPRSAYLVVQADPLVEAADPLVAQAAFRQAELRVVITSHWSATAAEADIVLPTTAFAENEGTLVNNEGRAQSFSAAAPPPGEARPTWKILRVLGNQVKVDGMDFTELEEVRSQTIQALVQAGVEHGAAPAHPQVIPEVTAITGEGLWRIPARHIYHDDLTVRNAPALQEAFGELCASLHPDTAEERGLREGSVVPFIGTGKPLWLPIQLDSGVPRGTIWIPAGEASTPLGPAYGFIEVAASLITTGDRLTAPVT